MGAWLSALAALALAGAYGLFILLMLLIEPDLFWIGFALWMLAPLVVIAGVLLALRQRLKEIDGGEEDEAAKY